MTPRPLLLVATLLQLAVTLPAAAAPALPDFAAVRRTWQPSEARLLDRHGEVLSELRADPKGRRLAWVGLEEISPAMRDALIASEDRRFAEHDGVDWQALAGAAWDSLWRARPRGASTLSMQLAGLLSPDLAMKGGSRTLGQKWDQIQAARDMEKHWTKNQILEAYLNLVPFRGELVGIHAAARGLFDKHPSGLNRDEAAMLAALLRGPNAAPAKVAQRACGVQRIQGFAADSCNGLEALAVAKLAGAYRITPAIDLAPHVAHRLLKPGDGDQATTLDAAIQRHALQSLRSQLAELDGRHVEDGAVVVIDNASGELLAWVGSGGDYSSAAQVDGVLAQRQAGSTLKPFLYGLLLETRILTAASLLEDSPVTLDTPSGLYAPQDYDKDFKGTVSVRTALASSLNVPAVRALQLAGADAFLDRLRRFGLATLDEPADYYGYALALGGADVRLLDLANAYRALANGGRWSPTRLRRDEPAGTTRQAMAPAASFIVADILADRGARALTFGLDNPLATRIWSAAKTGTSKDMRDNWCIGFSERFTVGVWVGNFSGAAMHDVSGISGAAPIWRDVMHFLHTSVVSHPPRPPQDAVSTTIRFTPAVEAPRREWFLAGTEQSIVALRGEDGSGEGSPRIAYPATGSVIALDPDIPTGQEGIPLVAKPAPEGLMWRIDGEPVANFWTPSTGRHRLQLLDSDGHELDAVRFEVRGRRSPDEGRDLHLDK